MRAKPRTPLLDATRGERGFAIGYRQVHPDANMNYQLNRLLSDGSPAMHAEVEAIAPRIKTFDDWAHQLFAVEESASREGREADAARYARAGEFFLSPGDPRKAAAYDRFRARFEQAAAGRFERHEVPFGAASLPAIRLRRDAGRGVVVVCGGFDSFIEEFFAMLEVLHDRGLDVIAFDGPGQGGALHHHGLTMIPEWERPTGAILDHFGVRDVTFIGISLGGGLAIRAAAFEPRIARVVAFDVLDDFFETVSTRRGRLVGAMVRAALAVGADTALDRLVRRVMTRDLLLRWGFEQGMMVTGTRTPSAFLREARRYRTAPYADRVTQDVLLLAGEDDHLVPRRQLARQASTLVHARSITTRVFLRSEQAASHCQMGNLPLALDTIGTWIESRSSQH